MDGQKDRLDASLQKAPENYRKLIRTGSYGSFFNYYICQLIWPGRPTSRAAPRCSRGSGKTGGGAPNPDAEIPWNASSSGRVHWRRPRILIVLVGLSPEKLTSMGDGDSVPGAVRRRRWSHGGQRRDHLRNQGRKRLGCRAAGRNALVTFTIDGSVARIGHHRTCAHRNASRRTCADTGIRGRRHACTRWT